MSKPLTDAELIRYSARRACSTSIPSVSYADLVQIGWLALLEADKDGRIPADAGSRAAYLSWRVYGAMLDALRVERRQFGFADGGRDADVCDPMPGPERLAQFNQAARIFERRATVKVRLALEMIVQGHSRADIARFCGVTNAAITLRMRDAVAILEDLI